MMSQCLLEKTVTTVTTTVTTLARGMFTADLVHFIVLHASYSMFAGSTPNKLVYICKFAF